MSNIWIERYQKSAKLGEKESNILLGFNANIDRIYQLDSVDIELKEAEPVKHRKVRSLKEMKEFLKYCWNKGLSTEVDIEDVKHPSGGKLRAGGQPSIMANFLANIGDKPVFYTPELSKELAEQIKEKVMFPVVEGEKLKLNPVRESVNSDRTKENLIFEYDLKDSGRVIFSSSIKGFGPYFDSEIEEKMDILDKKIDRAILSGFHDAEGNVDAKLRKSKKQIEQLETPVHLEYVHRDEKYAEKIFRYIVPEIESIGLDKSECKELSRTLDAVEEIVDPNLGQAFKFAKDLIHGFKISRVHIHTVDYHLCVSEISYEDPKTIRRAMLFGDLCAYDTCNTGSYPSQDELGNDISEKELQDVKDLEEFGSFFNKEEFKRTGIAKIKGLNVVAIPPLIDQDPERMVGIGDIISCGSFVGEAKAD